MPVEPEAWKKIMSNSLGPGGKPGPYCVYNAGGEQIVGQDGAPGFAEAIDRDLGVRPFAFTTSKKYATSDFIPLPIGNVLRDLFKQIAPKLLRFPSATRNPLEMKGQKGWSELVDPVSALIPETVAPLGPISPDTRQRKLVPSRRGVKGISSHINLIVDCSISMDDSSTYAIVEGPKGEIQSAGGRFSARFVAALLIEQAKSLGDSFSVFTFGGDAGVTTLTKGASRDYKGVVDYLLTPDEQFVKADGSRDDLAAPFVPSDSTPLHRGIAACASTMIQNRDKIRGALTIVIIDGHPNGNGKNLTNESLARMNRQLPIPHLFAQTGAATQLITEWDYDNYGTVKRYRQANDWNPSGNPSMWLNDERLRREFGPVLYVVVGSGDDESMVQTLSQNFNAALMNYYNGTNYGVIQRSRRRADDTHEFETEIALGNDARVGRPGGAGWGPWGWTTMPPAGTGISNLDASEWNPPSIRGPCQACSQSFTISTGVLGLSSFGGGLLQMARAGKGGSLQRLCFTKRK